MSRVEVIKAKASQVVWFDAPEGRPSATPTVGTKTSGGSVLTAAATTYVTIDPVSTTINATAAINATSLTVAAVTSILVGQEYLVTNALGQKERVRITGIKDRK